MQVGINNFLDFIPTNLHRAKIEREKAKGREGGG